MLPYFYMHLSISIIWKWGDSMSNIKKAGLIVGFVLIGLTIIVLIIGNKIMGNGGSDSSNKSAVSSSSSSSSVSTRVVKQTQIVKQENVQTETKAVTENREQEKEIEEIKKKNIEIVEINSAELNEGEVYKEFATVKDKKAYYSEGQVYYALILKTETGKVIKYYVAYSNYISFDIESEFELSIKEYKDDNGNIAYCVEDIVTK